jgi:hypothetical protein
MQGGAKRIPLSTSTLICFYSIRKRSSRRTRAAKTCTTFPPLIFFILAPYGAFLSIRAPYGALNAM